MTPEIHWLTLTILMTALFWLPYIVNFILEVGLWPAMQPNTPVPAEAAWARRAKAAHSNAVENLVLFAPLVLAVHVVGATSSATATACAVYFFARAAHFIVYTTGVPALRTLAFAAGFGAQMTLVAALLGAG